MHRFTGEDNEMQANWVPQGKHGGGLSDVHKHDANGKQSTAAVPGETCTVMSLGHTCSRELLEFPSSGSTPETLLHPVAMMPCIPLPR